MSKPIKIAWLQEPKSRDYSAAERYLALVFELRSAARFVKRMRKTSITHYAARDILRAAGVSPLAIVASDEERKKILAGEAIAPLLLVRQRKGERVIVADGFHRLCTVCTIDQVARVPCKIV